LEGKNAPEQSCTLECTATQNTYLHSGVQISDLCGHIHYAHHISFCYVWLKKSAVWLTNTNPNPLWTPRPCALCMALTDLDKGIVDPFAVASPHTTLHTTLRCKTKQLN